MVKFPLKNLLTVRESTVKHTVRAKFYRTPDGECKLAKVQCMSLPIFKEAWFEPCGYDEARFNALFDEAEEALAEPSENECDSASESDKKHNAWRNLHRAKLNAFDKILCNPDLDTFVTFTISPDAVNDRTSWEDVYKRIRMWLSNRVTREGLKYVICPERHKAGGIHFHAIMNSSALKLIPATNAKTGEPLTHNGAPLYNIADWSLGFTSAERIQSATLDREKVAKYIFKYMGKQGTQGKIGGRYALIGGQLASPIYFYGEDPREFLPDTEGYYRTSTHEGIDYQEWSFI